MSMSVCYETLNGRTVYENRGGAESSYGGDPLGSMAIVIDGGGASVCTRSYWPYGEVLSSIGDNPSDWEFGGLLGYRTDIVDSILYVRSRDYSPETAQWFTVDPLWPTESPYRYCNSRPTFEVDPLGLAGVGTLPGLGGAGAAGAGAAGAGAAGSGVAIGAGAIIGITVAVAGLCLVVYAVVAGTATTSSLPCDDAWRKATTALYHSICDKFKQKFSTPFDTRACKYTDSCYDLCWKLYINEYCGYYRQLVKDRCYPDSTDPYDTHGDQLQAALQNHIRCQVIISNFPGGCNCSSFGIDTILQKML